MNTEVHSYEIFQNDRASALLHASAADRRLRHVPQTRPLGRAGGNFYPCCYRNAGADGHARTHADRDALMASKNAEGHTVEEMVTEKSGQTGEKIELAYYGRIEAPYCAAYVHFNKKLGTILGFNKEIPAEVAHTVTMQATAMAPVSISEADCPAEVVEHERKIAVEAMKQDPKNANKPEAILEKIAEGKMRKFFEENTLLAQPVVGEKESIADYIHKADKDATVVAYKRFALGE